MKNISNNSGMASVLFAMTFAIVLSLIAIGFATLVRNDQREVLDQTLGYQAQYAAEAAVNQVQAAIKEGDITGAEPDCQKIDFGNEVRATCVKWDDISDSILFTKVSENRGPRSFKLTTDGTGSLDGLVITWQNTPSDDPYTLSTDNLPNSISNTDTKSILKIALARSDGTNFSQLYLVPSTTGSGTISASDNGGVVRTTCSAGNECSVTISDVSGYVNGYFAVSVIGKIADTVNVKAVGTKFKGVQYTVDATAIANDVTNRVEARINPETSTWRPGNAVSADKICKDIRIDGNTNKLSVSTGAAGSACPLNP